MIEQKIDLSSIVLPNAHTAVFNCNRTNSSFSGFIIDSDGNVLENITELEDNFQAYFLMYKDTNENDERFVPDFKNQKPTNILRIKLNNQNKEMSLEIQKMINAIKAPFIGIAKLFGYSDKDKMKIAGLMSTWQITSAVLFRDEHTGKTVPSTKIVLHTFKVSRNEESANFARISINYAVE